MSFLQGMIRCFKFCTGLLMLPVCYGATVAVCDRLFWMIWAEKPFIWGFGVFVLIFAIFKQPVRTYVFGHELTHALWILIFRGDVTAFSATVRGGKVEGTKGNFLITLSPYFFPVYTLLLIGVYFMVRLFRDPRDYFVYVVFLLGFSWAFHVILTISILLRGQQEIKQQGYLFSLPVIYLLNIVALGAVIVFFSPRFGWYDLKQVLMGDIMESYRHFAEMGFSLMQKLF